MEREERPRGEEVVGEACCADMEVMEMERISRRAVAGCVCGAVAMMLVSPYRAYAKQGIDFNKRGGSGAKKKAETKYAFRTVPLTDYTRDERTGLLFYDVTEGFGRELSVGDTATVHFDCRFRGIDAVSSRQAALLGGNRTIAQPAVVKVGERPIKGKKGGAGRSDDLLEKSGGLYTGSKGPVRCDIYSPIVCIYRHVKRE